MYMVYMYNIIHVGQLTCTIGWGTAEIKGELLGTNFEQEIGYSSGLHKRLG